MKPKFPIESEAVWLKDVLKGEYNILVYQRPYEWDDKNIDDFLSSIFMGFNEKIEKKLESKPIFFGTIQLNRDNKNDKALDIVDGQQRLTTFLLFLNILQMNVGKEVFVVFIVKYNYRKLQMRIGECCISKLEKVAKHSLKTLRNGVAPEW